MVEFLKVQSHLGYLQVFKSQNALAVNEDPNKASKPFSKNRNGIVVAEGGAIYILERLEDALNVEQT